MSEQKELKATRIDPHEMCACGHERSRHGVFKADECLGTPEKITELRGKCDCVLFILPVFDERERAAQYIFERLGTTDVPHWPAGFGLIRDLLRERDEALYARQQQEHTRTVSSGMVRYESMMAEARPVQQPAPMDADELRLDGIMASTPSGALDVIAPTYGGISRSNWPARPVQQPATEPDEQRTRLLKIASKVAQRQYLPSLEKCRTINDARIEVARYDEYHAALAQQLKDVFDALALRDVPQGPDDREIVAEWRSCLCAAWASGHRAVMTILLESGPSYPARQAPVGPEGKK